MTGPHGSRTESTLRSQARSSPCAGAGDNDIMSLKLQAMLFGAVPSSIQTLMRRRSYVFRVAGGLSCAIVEAARSASSCVSPARSRTRPCRWSPAASAEDAASLSQTPACLRQARAELRDHLWAHCVATCRQVLETALVW
jgi:hypothetical protein